MPAARNVQVTLAVTNGVLTLAGTSGLTVSGNGTGTVTVTGTLANINTALNGLVFQPTGNFNGAANLTVTTNDQGNTGSGGALSDTDTVAITVNAVNDAPVNTVPGGADHERGRLAHLLRANGNAISIADVDAGSSNVQVTLAATNGVLTLAGTSGLTVSGNGTGTVTVTGTLANINTAINGLVFAPTGNFNGAANLTVTTSDQGNTGSGGAKTDSRHGRHHRQRGQRRAGQHGAGRPDHERGRHADVLERQRQRHLHRRRRCRQQQRPGHARRHQRRAHPGRHLRPHGQRQRHRHGHRHRHSRQHQHRPQRPDLRARATSTAAPPSRSPPATSAIPAPAAPRPTSTRSPSPSARSTMLRPERTRRSRPTRTRPTPSRPAISASRIRTTARPTVCWRWRSRACRRPVSCSSMAWRSRPASSWRRARLRWAI